MKNIPSHTQPNPHSGRLPARDRSASDTCRSRGRRRHPGSRGRRRRPCCRAPTPRRLLGRWADGTTPPRGRRGQTTAAAGSASFVADVSVIWVHDVCTMGVRKRVDGCLLIRDATSRCILSGQAHDGFPWEREKRKGKGESRIGKREKRKERERETRKRNGIQMAHDPSPSQPPKTRANKPPTATLFASALQLSPVRQPALADWGWFSSISLLPRMCCSKVVK